MSSSTMESESPVNSFSESATKRKREEFTTSESESDTSDAAETEVLSQRLVLIEVTTLIQKERRTRQGVVHEKQERDILMFLPEHIVHQIPKYAASFEEIGVADHVDGDIAFDDDDTHDHRAFVQTIDFVGGASLRPLAGSTESIKETLKDLLGMYVVAVSLKIETLQVAILEHIESCPDMPIDIFLEFAKSFYDGCEPDDSKQNAIESPIGKLIKRKLEILLPQLLQDGTAQRIKAGGGTLSTQLLEVMIEQFSGKGGIKIEE